MTVKTWLQSNLPQGRLFSKSYYIVHRETTYIYMHKIGEESVEVGRTCRTNERGSTTKDGICSPGEGKKKERNTTYEMARLHRET